MKKRYKDGMKWKQKMVFIICWIMLMIMNLYKIQI